ncbi:MAG: VapC toxin family PIN domain ribonuclease [Ardenticatenaceae bacterium]|nr:VapC toxin family PIN domain ribonuclease [Ardenticatenaceae bacterium]
MGGLDLSIPSLTSSHTQYFSLKKKHDSNEYQRLIRTMRPQPSADVIRWWTINSSTLFTNAVTRAEIELVSFCYLKGIESKRLPCWRKEMLKFLQRCLPFGELAAVHYGPYHVERIKIGRPIFCRRCTNCISALANGLRLATRNEKDFAEIPNLVVINPWR